MVSGGSQHSQQSGEDIAQRSHGQELVAAGAAVEQVGGAQGFVSADMFRGDEGRVEAGGETEEDCYEDGEVEGSLWPIIRCVSRSLHAQLCNMSVPN